VRALISALGLLLAGALLPMSALLLGPASAPAPTQSTGSAPDAESGCEYWVAPPLLGNDANPGTADAPWMTLEHASETAADNNCTIWFYDGNYFANQRINRRFTTPTTIKAINPYRAAFKHAGPVLSISGATNLTLEGFVLQHSSPAAAPLLVQVDGSHEGMAEGIVLRNNIFHDSFNNDLLKILSGARHVVVEGNVFYNQGPTDEHIDVNSVTDVVIQDNIFFNDFAGSGREVSQTSHSYITIKDSNEGVDGLEGSERITVRRNVFLNWEGGRETFIQIGNDGKPFHEAKDIAIENNLFIGNSPNNAYAILGVRGARDVVFANNTAVGDYPSSAYAMWIALKDANPVNENIAFYNNIWSDPTGSMGSYHQETDDNEFSKGNPLEVINAVLDNNLYWNGSSPVPGGDLFTPEVDDARALMTDPLLNIYQDAVVLPRWNGEAFLSGNGTIRQEFLRLVEAYGVFPPGSPAIGKGDPAHAPADDILGRARSATPELGAFEYQLILNGSVENTDVHLNWSQLNEANAASLRVTATAVDGTQTEFTNIPADAREFTLTDLAALTQYTIRLVALDSGGNVLVESNVLQLETGSHWWCLPFILIRQ
jgi:hypothetical protein